MTLKIDRKAFFDGVRKEKFFGPRLSQEVVANLTTILDAIEDEPLVSNSSDVAYIFATVYGESYHARKNPGMNPVREGFTLTDKGARQAVGNLFRKGKIRVNYAAPDPQTGLSYYGRGYAQITWAKNYIRLGDDIGVDLYHNPDFALQKPVAAKLLVYGMVHGAYTGKALHSYAPYRYVAMRAIINGSDRAETFASHAKRFQHCVKFDITDGHPDDNAALILAGEPVAVRLNDPLPPLPVDTSTSTEYTPSFWSKVWATVVSTFSV